MSNLNNRPAVTIGNSNEVNQQQQETPRTEKWNSGGKQNQQQKKGNQQKLTPSSITFSPVEFESTLRSSIYTTYEIVDMLSSVFKPAFADFFKARFYPDQKGNLICQLLFAPSNKRDDNRIYALHEKGSNSGDGAAGGQILQTIRKWNSSINTSSHFELSTEAKEILAPFIPPAFRIQNQMDHSYEPALPKINWKSFFREEQVNVSVGFGMGVSNKIVYVVPIDIYTFAKKFWGERGDEGGRFFYNIEPFTPMTNQFIGMGMPNAYGMRPNIQDTIWAFRVERCDETFLEGVKRKLGFGNV